MKDIYSSSGSEFSSWNRILLNFHKISLTLSLKNNKLKFSRYKLNLWSRNSNLKFNSNFRSLIKQPKAPKLSGANRNLAKIVCYHSFAIELEIK